MNDADLTSFPLAPAGKTGWPWNGFNTPVPITLSGGDPWPGICVVTPSFNQGRFLEATIRSVLLQGYPNLEYIVIDGGSSDDSLRIIQKYKKYLAYWISEPDKGQGHAINKGFAHSTKGIMGWLNSDDVLLPQALVRIGRAFARIPSPAIVTGFRKVVDAEGNFCYNWTRGFPKTNILKYNCCVAQETTYWRRELWQNIGPLDEDFQYALDYEYWQRTCAAGYHFTLMPYYTGILRQHSASKGALWSELQKRELRQIYAKYTGSDISEEEATSLLGSKWSLEHALIKDICHQQLSNRAFLLWVFLLVLDLPIISDFVILLYRFYKAIN